jgi:hypothetical protein
MRSNFGRRWRRRSFEDGVFKSQSGGDTSRRSRPGSGLDRKGSQVGVIFSGTSNCTYAIPCDRSRFIAHSRPRRDRRAAQRDAGRRHRNSAMIRVGIGHSAHRYGFSWRTGMPPLAEDARASPAPQFDPPVYPTRFWTCGVSRRNSTRGRMTLVIVSARRYPSSRSYRFPGEEFRHSGHAAVPSVPKFQAKSHWHGVKTPW